MPPKWWDPIMSRVIAVMACGVSLAACSASMPSLDFLKSAPQTEALRIESEPPGADAKTSSGQSCRTPCELAVQPGGEFSVTLALERLSAADRVGPSGGARAGARRLAAARAQPGPCGTAAGGCRRRQEAGGEEKEAGRGSGASGTAARSLGRASPCPRACAGPCALADDGTGGIRDQLSLAVEIALAVG